MIPYANGEVLNYATLNNSDKWHLEVYYLRKMIFAKACYNIYHDKLWAIVKDIKTWQYYQKIASTKF